MSRTKGCDIKPGANLRGADRVCLWCRHPFAGRRRDAKYCSKRCRQASWRFGSHCVARRRATEPMRWAYADPPYPGLARYYADHPDFGGEVDHAALVSSLEAGHFDAWSLSTSSKALSMVLSICFDYGADVRVGAWFRGSRPGRSHGPRQAWEPVIYRGGRRDPSREYSDDALVHHARPRLTDPGHVIGAKPAAFAFWLFDLMGALPGDELVDLYPGSGGITRAWSRFAEASRLQA